MAPVPDGVYRFDDHMGYLAIRDTSPESPVVVSSGYSLPPVWQIKNEDDGTLTVWSTLQGLRMYLSYAGGPRVATLLVSGAQPTRWELRPGFDEYHVVIAVPARLLAPEDKDGLAVDLGRARSYPPETALMRLDPENDVQNWRLVRLS
ncbi:hypothetical protein [Catenulispora rubra]|uniref:hypothetical protein n=1 Tax=Catenulispora rubra TaxID=280293 RepID=UPI0018922FA5|nr:hypothetical protein [Catenulispora rubra]